MSALDKCGECGVTLLFFRTPYTCAKCSTVVCDECSAFTERHTFNQSYPRVCVNCLPGEEDGDGCTYPCLLRKWERDTACVDSDDDDDDEAEAKVKANKNKKMIIKKNKKPRRKKGLDSMACGGGIHLALAQKNEAARAARLLAQKARLQHRKEAKSKAVKMPVCRTCGQTLMNGVVEASACKHCGLWHDDSSQCPVLDWKGAYRRRTNLLVYAPILFYMKTQIGQVRLTLGANAPRHILRAEYKDDEDKTITASCRECPAQVPVDELVGCGVCQYDICQPCVKRKGGGPKPKPRLGSKGETGAGGHKPQNFYQRIPAR